MDLGSYLWARHISPEQARLGVGIKNQATESLTSDSDYATDVQMLVSNE